MSAAFDVDRAQAHGRELAGRLLVHGVLGQDTHGSRARLSPPSVIEQDEVDRPFRALRSRAGKSAPTGRVQGLLEVARRVGDEARGERPRSQGQSLSPSVHREVAQPVGSGGKLTPRATGQPHQGSRGELECADLCS